MPARALFRAKRGKIPRQTLPLAPHQPITAGDTPQHSVGKAASGKPQLPKSASVGTDLCLLRDSRLEPGQGSSESLPGACPHSMAQFPEDPGQMRDRGADPFSTSSSSQCSSQLSGDSMGGESTWDQVCPKIPEPIVRLRHHVF